MNTLSLIPLTALPIICSVLYPSAVSINAAPSSIPFLRGSIPPLYLHVPSPISGIITPVFPSSFSSIGCILFDFSCYWILHVRMITDFPCSIAGLLTFLSDRGQADKEHKFPKSTGISVTLRDRLFSSRIALQQFQNIVDLNTCGV